MPVEDLQIRRAKTDDYLAVHDMFSYPKAIRETLQLPYPSLEYWRQRISEPGEGLYDLVAEASARVVGMLTVITFPNKPRRRHAGALAMSVHDEWQGKGIGSALMQAGVDLADRWLNLGRLELEVYTDNEPAIRLYERFGFEREGVLRHYGFRDGEYVDAYCLARLRP